MKVLKSNASWKNFLVGVTNKDCFVALLVVGSKNDGWFSKLMEFATVILLLKMQKWMICISLIRVQQWSMDWKEQG